MVRRTVLALATMALGFAVSAVTVPNSGARVASIYVATNGSDANDGSTAATALGTLGQALKQARPGDTIRVLPGSYTESIRRRVLGTQAQPIRIVGENGRPVFDGKRSERYGLWLEESEHVVVENLEFRDYTSIGIVVVLSDHITLRKLRVRGNGFASQIGWAEGYGIHLDESSNLLVERNNVSRNGPNPRPWNMAGTGINGFAMRDTVIRRNRSHHNNGGGVLVEDSVNVLVERNRIFANDLDVSADEWWDGGIWLDGGRDVTLRANRIYDNLGPAIEISDEDCQSPTGYVIKRNVTPGNYFGIFVWNFGSADFPGPPVLTMSRNDFSGNSRLDVWIDPSREDC